MSDNIPTINFKGVEPWDGTKGGANDPEPGSYKARTTGAAFHTASSGKVSIKVSVALDGAGGTDLYLGTDLSREANKRKIATALLSCGVDLTKLAAAGDIGLDRIVPLFMGRDGKGADCFVIVKYVDGVDEKGRKKLNDKEFLTKDQHATYKAPPVPASRPATANGATGGTNPTPPAAGNTGDLAGLFG